MESLETGGHLVSDEAGRVKGHPGKEMRKVGNLTTLSPAVYHPFCLMGCVARRLDALVS